jgi:hypothetical protein
MPKDRRLAGSSEYQLLQLVVVPQHSANLDVPRYSALNFRYYHFRVVVPSLCSHYHHHEKTNSESLCPLLATDYGSNWFLSECFSTQEPTSSRRLSLYIGKGRYVSYITISCQLQYDVSTVLLSTGNIDIISTHLTSLLLDPP